MSTATETRKPTLSDVLMQSLGAASGGMRVCVPGTVVSSRVDGTVDVSVSVQGLRDGKPVTEPTLRSVPLLALGNPRAAVSPPALPGDPVLLIFGDRDLDRWKATHGLGTSVAATPRQHDLTDCVAVPVAWGAPLTLELWSVFALAIDALVASIGVAPGAPQTFVPAMTLIKARLLAAGIKAG